MREEVSCSSITKKLGTKSIHRSRAGIHFHGTENVIWAGFGSVGKKNWADYEQLLSSVFPCFHGQKN